MTKTRASMIVGAFILWMTLVFWASSQINGQTRIADWQILPSDPQIAHEFCPGPPMVKTSDTEIVFGLRWTALDPCHMHVSQFRAVQVPQGGKIKLVAPIVDDEVYISYVWPTVATAPQVLVPTINVKGPAAQYDLSECPGCVLKAATPQTFAALSVPIGVWPVRASTFTLKGHNILDMHQIFIGSGSGMLMEYSNGGYLFQIQPPPDPAKVAKAAADQYKMYADGRIKEIVTQEANRQVKFMKQEMYVRYMPPPPDPSEVQKMREEIGMMRDALESQRQQGAQVAESSAEQTHMAVSMLQVQFQEKLGELDKIKAQLVEVLNKAKEKPDPLRRAALKD